MTSVRALEPDLQQSVISAVSTAYISALDTLSDAERCTPRRDLAPVAAQLILKTVTDAISMNHVRENERASLQERLPDELWCNIWGHLPRMAKLAVARTCRRWRTISLACATLWADPSFFTSLPITGQMQRVPYTGWNDSPYPKNRSTMWYAREILALSKSAPLSLKVDIVPCYADLEPLRKLAQEMKRYLPRLRHLRIRSADLVAVKEFLGYLDPELGEPPLKHLALEHLHNYDAVSQRAEAIPAGWTLPHLQSVRLGPGYLLPSNGQVFSSVRTLDIAPGWELDQVLITALKAFPAIDALRVHIKDVSSRALRSLPSEELRTLLARVPSVTLSVAYEERAEMALAQFHDPARRAFVLEGWWRRYGTRYRTVLRDLAQDVLLRVLCDETVSFAGIDAGGRERCIDVVCDDALLVFMDEFLDLSAVVALTISASLLEIIWCTFPSVTLLEIIVDDLDTLETYTQLQIAPFPALQSLALIESSETIKVRADDVIGFARVLRLPDPLVSVSIDHRIYEGDLSPEVQLLAQAVVVGVCHVSHPHALSSVIAAR